MLNQNLCMRGVSELEPRQLQLREFFGNAGFSQDLIQDLELLFEELTVNALSHGGSSQVEILLSIEEGRARLEFRDDGSPFDPLRAEERPLDEDDLIGGWGIPLLHSLSDGADYRREDGRNVLVLVRGERDS